VNLPDAMGIRSNLSVAAVDALTAPRTGPRPNTRRILPHRQLDQLPTPELLSELVSRSIEIPFVDTKQSRMAPSGSWALCLADHRAAGPIEAFIDAHEFCHIHPLPESSVHVTLPPPIRQQVMDLAWGEPHLISKAGIFESLVTLYVPRDVYELNVVLYLISQSCLFAQGRLPSASGDPR
jgi:phospholipase/carboxylesterase